ncbi:NADH:flavin oxidoreductase/NADH oxidase [Prosthecomicrobium sp. N25]|uniref:NADH:flavin oxidoreductase/NADH oxidase n=1 Tax=Prosthecomicrobium sp. N25 TaxID=3129254 RepID=UPI003077C1C0
MSKLFTPLTIGPMTVANRIVVSPMCQYSAVDGCATDWHQFHVPSLALSGAGLVILEATAVERLGRITHGCLGLYSDDNERALDRVVKSARAFAPKSLRLGIQIAHAGRKASSQRPWEGGGALRPDQDPWQTFAPSAIPFDDGYPAPAALADADLERIRDAFVQAARRAARIGFDLVELHMAHGYLLHSFVSPIANRREDRWGGDLVGRMAFPLEVARAVRAAVPGIALSARITGSDWSDAGLTPDDAVAAATMLKGVGLDAVVVSSGGITPKIRVGVGPNYQVPFAARVKRETGILTQAVGMIVDPLEAEAILERGEADQIALARAVLDDPRWGLHAAEKLGVEAERPVQYVRVAPKHWPGAALKR